MKNFKQILSITMMGLTFGLFGQTPTTICSTTGNQVTVGNCVSDADWGATNGITTTPTPDMCAISGSRDKFIYFQATSTSTQVSFANTGSRDVSLYIYNLGGTATCPGATPSAVACSNSTAAGGSETVVVSTTINNYYLVQVVSSGNSSTGNLCVTNYIFNNECSTATSISSNTTCSTTTGNITGATESQAGCSGTANDDVWYSFVAVSSSQTIQVVGSASFNPVFQLFSGSCGALTSIQCVNANATNGGTETQAFTGLAPGNTYFVRVYDFAAGIPATPTFTICVTHSVNDFIGSSTGFSMSTNTGCALATYTFNQTTANTNNARIQPLPKQITINFPSGTNCATATTAGSTFNGTAIPSFTSQTGNTITFNAPVTVGKNAAFTINIANVTNAPSLTSAPASVVAQNEGGGLNVWTGYSVTTTPCPTVPTNNECATPIVLTPSASGSGVCSSINGTSFGATASGQTSCSGTADDDVWYSFVANNTTHQVIVDGDANFNAVVQVFSGTCAGTLTSISCQNTTGLNGVETASLTGLTIGQTYIVRIYHSAPSYGSTATNAFTVCVTSSAPPCTLGAGNIIGVALPYSSGAQTNCGAGNDITSANSSVCGSGSYYGGEDKVITFTPGTSGNVSINLTSTGSWVGMMLYQGCPTAGGTCVAYAQSSAGNQSIGCAAVVSGQTYYLVVDSYPLPNCNPFSVTISAPTGGIPAGTTCSNAVAMTLPYTATGQSTLCYGNDYTNASAGSCGTLYESGEDKVYAFTTTGPDCLSLVLSNASSTFIGYQVYSGCPGVIGTTCISNGGGATSGTLTGSFTVTSAGTYYVVVDTWASPSYVNYDIQLVSLGGTPTNDICSGATSLPVGTSVFGDNNCTGSETPAVPGTWTAGNVNTVWFSVVVPASGQVLVKTTAGTLTNTQIAAYSGTCGALTFISANNDIGSCGGTTNSMSQLTITATAGSTIYIRVDGEQNAVGSFTITAIDPTTSVLPGVQGQDCSQPNPVCQGLISVSNPGYSGNGNVCDINTGYCLASGERNVVWYRVPILTGGTLNFNIVPNDFVSATENETDYDFAVWQSVDGSGSGNAYSCAQIAAGTAPTLACNYSFLGVTGVGTGGNAPTSLSGGASGVCPQCGGGYNPSGTYSGAYEPTINTTAGDEYLIAISNFSNSTSGFKIEFLGTAVINFAAATATAEVYWTGGDATVPTEVNDVDNWGGCTSPTCGIDAFVSAVSNSPIVASGSTRSVRDLTIQPGATLTLQANSILEVCGNYVNYGTLIADPTSTVIFRGPAAQSVSGNLLGTSKFGNVTITKPAASGSVTLMNDIEIGGTLTTTDNNSILNTNGKYVSLGRHFTNFNGNATYANTGTTGTIEFNGSGAQNYNQGSSQLDLNFVIINNSAGIGSGVNLLSNMFVKTITGTLTLTNGTISTGALRVEVNNTTPASVSTGTTNSFVDGNLRRYLTTSGAYNWPVGNVAKGYQRAFTNFTSCSIGFIDSRFDNWSVALPIQGGAECGTVWNLVAQNNGVWTLTANAGTGAYNMTLYPTNATNVAGSAWTIIKKAPPQTTTGWLLDGACAASTSSVVNRNGMSGFSIFSVAQATLPLPVELINFDGEMVGEDNLLSWSTVSEHNNDYFTLERSRNGYTFEEMAIIAGAGNSSTLLNYSEFDYDPFNGITYYRLKQTDYDGQYSYSQVIALNRGLENMLVSDLFPNPANESVNFTVDSPRNGTVVSEMYDLSGRLILSNTFQVHKGSNSFNIKLDGLAHGVYTVVLKSDLLEQSELKQLIKH
ncbi:MAG: T9SS type A sorting domain-containing protein [Bacteroidota bacterium]